MSEDIKPARKGINKKVVAIVAAAVLVLGGGVTAGVIGINNYNAETERLCLVATDHAAAVQKDAKTAVTAADEALKAVESTKLPEEAGESTKYADRKAVEEVKAQKAEGDKPEVKAVPARPSGADFIADVTDARDKVAKIKLATECADRDTAAQIENDADKAETQVTELKDATEALTADFAIFQKDEAARIAAEKKAAEEAAAAAAAEAARIAAEQAAAEEAARQAAAQQEWSNSNSYSGGGGGGGYSGGGGGGGGYTPPANSGGGGGGGGYSGGDGGDIGTILVPPGGDHGTGCPPAKPICYG